MQVSRALEKLLRVLLDVRRLEPDLSILEQAREVMVHVGKDHECLARLEVGMIGCSSQVEQRQRPSWCSRRMLNADSPGSYARSTTGTTF